MCVCVCVCVLCAPICLYWCVIVCVYVYVYIQMPTCVCVCAYMRTFFYLCFMHISACLCVCVRVRVCMCMCVCYGAVHLVWDSGSEALLYDLQGQPLQAFNGSNGCDRRSDYVVTECAQVRVEPFSDHDIGHAADCEGGIAGWRGGRFLRGNGMQ